MFQKPVFGRKGLPKPQTQATAQAKQSAFEPFKPSSFFPGAQPDVYLGDLTDEINRLDKYQRGLAKLGRRYVTTGEPADFPQKIKQIDQATPYNKKPSYNDNQGRNDAAGKADLAIGKGEISDLDILRRFLAIRTAIDSSVTVRPWNAPAVPDEHIAPREFHSALMQAITRLRNRDGGNTGRLAEPILSAASVAKTVCSLGGDMVLYFRLAVHEADWGGREHPLTDDPTFKAMCDQYADDLAEAYKTEFAETWINPAHSVFERMGLYGNPVILDAVFSRLGKGNAKPLRDKIIGLLSKSKHPAILPAIEARLASGELEIRSDCVQIATKIGSDAAVEILRAHRENERSAAITGAIDAVLDTLELVDEGGQSAQGEITLANGETISLPPVDESFLVPPTKADKPHFDRLIALINEDRAEKRAKHDWARKNECLDPITPQEADDLFAWVCEEKPRPEWKQHHSTRTELYKYKGVHEDATAKKVHKWFDDAPDALRWAALLRMAATVSIADLVGHYETKKRITQDYLDQAIRNGTSIVTFAAYLMKRTPDAENTDSFAEAFSKQCQSMIGGWLSKSHWSWQYWKNPLEDMPAQDVHAILIGALPTFDRALGIAPCGGAYHLPHVFTLLAMLPALPKRYVPHLVELALSGKKTEREAIKPLLENADGMVERLEEALNDRRQGVRAQAAIWLADLRSASSEKLLRKRLKKEKGEEARAALIESLLRLDADLSDVIGPQALIAEAEKAKGKHPLPEWLTPETLPAVRFKDGTSAPRELLEYWIGLAHKLKDPGATGLFGIYLDQLEPEDAKRFSGQLLVGWIDYDTFGPSLEEANAYGQQRAQSAVRAGYWSGHGKSDEEIRQEVFTYYKNEKLRERPNTGTKSKGVLALACRADAAFAAERVRWFLKTNGRRSHQAMALLDMLAGIGSPTAMQVVIAASTRLKQKSTMAHANAIAERYAKDRGWTYDELADRTVPTAGFDDDGVLDLPCGMDEKPYSARLDALLTVHISNPAGKAIKSLPAGDDDATKESKKALSAGKRELKQIVTIQTQRLAEAMAIGRVWPVEDWVECFHGHPVMRRLIERLVWEGLDADGNSVTLLRPTQEGDFTDANDEDVDVHALAQLRLAHAALVDEPTADAWRAHLKDYEVKPLIDQFPKGFEPFGGEEPSATQVTSHFGWLGETRPYRGVAEKLGYQREMGDGGGCVGFYKEFPSVGITALVETYGGLAYDENLPQALQNLIFRKRGSYQGMALEEVPPVLLAMCHADLQAIAKKGAFDADWEKKVAW